MYQAIERVVDQMGWTEPVADSLQSRLHDIHNATEPASIPVKNALNGTWLGHPLHPAVTDVVVGAWTTATVLDVASMITGRDELAPAADIAIGTGLAAAVTSAATGVNDWSDTYGLDRKVGLIHGLLMTASTATYCCSLAARVSGRRTLGVLTAGLGLGILLAGTYLGGEEVFDLGYGVNHTAFDQPPEDWVGVLQADQLSEGKPQRAEAGGVPIMLLKSGSRIFAMADTCVHAGCSLSDGEVDGQTIRCGCHGSTYKLDDGSVVTGPATRPEPVYRVREVEGMIEVKGMS